MRSALPRSLLSHSGEICAEPSGRWPFVARGAAGPGLVDFGRYSDASALPARAPPPPNLRAIPEGEVSVRVLQPALPGHPYPGQGAGRWQRKQHLLLFHHKVLVPQPAPGHPCLRQVAPLAVAMEPAPAVASPIPAPQARPLVGLPTNPNPVPATPPPAIPAPVAIAGIAAGKAAARSRSITRKRTCSGTQTFTGRHLAPTPTLRYLPDMLGNTALSRRCFLEWCSFIYPDSERRPRS